MAIERFLCFDEMTGSKAIDFRDKLLELLAHFKLSTEFIRGASNGWRTASFGSQNCPLCIVCALHGTSVEPGASQGSHNLCICKVFFWPAWEPLQFYGC